jgi:hypothetical protein
MEIGISGSGAVRRRSTKSAPTIAAAARSARMGEDSQGWRTPARFKANMKDTLAITISTAPAKSRRCGRS